METWSSCVIRRVSYISNRSCFRRAIAKTNRILHIGKWHHNNPGKWGDFWQTSPFGNVTVFFHTSPDLPIFSKGDSLHIIFQFKTERRREDMFWSGWWNPLWFIFTQIYRKLDPCPASGTSLSVYTWETLHRPITCPFSNFSASPDTAQKKECW